MNALVYIIRKSILNHLKELLTKPGKMILYAVVILSIVGVALLSVFTRSRVETTTPMFFFAGILFLMITLFVVMSIGKGLSSGDAIFQMSDVNLVFVAPIDPRKILLYGLIRMAQAAFFGGFFILFQATTLAQFGIGYGGVLLTFAGFLLGMVALMLVSLTLYSLTNGRPHRKRLVKCLAVLLFAPLVAFTAYQYVNTRDVLVTLAAAIQSPFFSFVPVAGWVARGVTAFLVGDIANGCLFLGLNLLLGIGLAVYILWSNPDYYEDVLVAAETLFERKRIIAEGNVVAASASGRTVKVAKTGIPGYGAAAIFGKHMRENFRQNRFGLLGLPSVLLCISSVVLCYIIKDLTIVLQILMWMQIFLIGTGRGLKETYAHYIYLIPLSSFKKIVWSNMEIVARSLTEGLLIFIIGGLLIHAHPLYMLACLLVYVFLSLMLLGLNFFSMRFTGADISAGLLVMIYVFAVILVMAPGVTLALVVGFAVGGELGLLLGLLTLAAWELAAGLAFFALSADVLHNCDMPVMKTGN